MVFRERTLDTEKKIKNYYNNEIKIRSLVYRLGVIEKQKYDIEKDIKNMNLEFKNINHENINMPKFSSLKSLQNISIHSSIEYLEDELEKRKIDSIKIKAKIRMLEKENSEMESILIKLDKEALEIIELIYEKNKTGLQISKIINVDESTVSRKKDKIIEDIARCISWNI